MEDEKSKLALQLWNNLSKAHDIVRRVHVKKMSTYNLTVPQFQMLEVLKASGPMPLKRISEALLVTGANITYVVDILEKEELVVRVPSRKDRRVINAELTEKGIAKLEEIYPMYVENTNNISRVLTEEEQKQLTYLLDKLSV